MMWGVGSASPGLCAGLLRQLASLACARRGPPGQVQAPTLVVMESRTRISPDPAAEADWIADALRGRTVMVAQAGHYPQSQQPDLVSDAVESFLPKRLGRALGAGLTSDRVVTEAESAHRPGRLRQAEPRDPGRNPQQGSRRCTTHRRTARPQAGRRGPSKGRVGGCAGAVPRSASPAAPPSRARSGLTARGLTSIPDVMWLPFERPTPPTPTTLAAAQRRSPWCSKCWLATNCTGTDAVHAARALRSALHGFVSPRPRAASPSFYDLDDSYDRLVDGLVNSLESARSG